MTANMISYPFSSRKTHNSITNFQWRIGKTCPTCPICCFLTFELFVLVLWIIRLRREFLNFPTELHVIIDVRMEVADLMTRTGASAYINVGAAGEGLENK